MSIEKGLYEAPQGLASLHSIEIEIIDPEFEIDGEDESLELPSEEFGENLAESIDDGILQSLSSELMSDFEEDVSSRKDWMQTYVDGLELLGLKIENRSEPWEGACGVYHPLLAEALVKFQSETMMAIFPNGAHDDYVDSSTQALIRFRQGGFLRLDTDEKEDRVRYRKSHSYY